MGAGRVGTTADNGEVDPLVALLQESVGDLARDLGLGAPDEVDLALHESGGDSVGGRRRPPQGRHLLVVLHGA